MATDCTVLMPRTQALAAEYNAAQDARQAAADPFDRAAWDACRAADDRWRGRPHGRGAEPGDVAGGQPPGERPHGGDIQCRRCNAVCSMAGHPYGCPANPHGFGDLGDPLRLCYCGQRMVPAPELFGPCCQDTPPVRVPGGCSYCGSDLCKVNDPDDLPVKDYYTPERHPEMGNAWVHGHCSDEAHLAGAHPDREDFAVRVTAGRRQERHKLLGLFYGTVEDR